MDKCSFTRKYLPAARMAGELYGLNPVVILAQSAIETGWGESTLAVCYNNFFGLKGLQGIIPSGDKYAALQNVYNF